MGDLFACLEHLSGFRGHVGASLPSHDPSVLPVQTQSTLPLPEVLTAEPGVVFGPAHNTAHRTDTALSLLELKSLQIQTKDCARS